MLLIRKLPYLEERMILKFEENIINIGVDGSLKAVLLLEDGQVAYVSNN